jgi:hypothetical protein
MKKRIITTIIFSLLIFSGYTQSGGGNTFEFLNLPGNSRVSTLGGYNVSNYDNDLNFVLSNPALLNSSMHNQVSLNYINYLSDINFGYVSYATEIDNMGTFAGGMQYINYGLFLHTDETGEILGDFVPSEYSFNLYFARQITEKIYAGAGIKTIYSSFYTHFSSGIALDAGIAYRDTANLFSAGLVIKNLGTQIKPYTSGNYEPLPFDIQLGVTKGLAHAPFRFSLTFHNLLNWDLSYQSAFEIASGFGLEENQNESFFNKMENIADELMRHVVIGVELVPSESFYISLGYNYRRRSELSLSTKPGLVGMSIGAGLKLEKFSLGYGIASYHLAAASNHISLGINLGAFYKTTVL